MRVLGNILVSLLAVAIVTGCLLPIAALVYLVVVS